MRNSSFAKKRKTNKGKGSRMGMKGMRGGKRKFSNRRQAKRPVEKNLRLIVLTAATDNAWATQTTQINPALTFSATVSGLRWTLSVKSLANQNSATPVAYYWVIYIQRLTQAAPVLNAPNANQVPPLGATFLTTNIPLSDILAFSTGLCVPSDGFTHVGQVGTSRKLQKGDTIQLAMIQNSSAGGGGSAIGLAGVVQYFLRV